MMELVEQSVLQKKGIADVFYTVGTQCLCQGNSPWIPNGTGAVILHIMVDGEEKLIAYTSRTLVVAQKNYAQIDKKKESFLLHVYL